MDIKRARVFVVEDEKIMSTYVLGHLRKLGILDLYAFDSGVAALKELATLKPDLILTDVHMQPMTGIELVRKVRGSANSQLSNIPVIFLTADATAATVSEALSLDVAGYIVKPPSAVALGNKIEQALRNS